MLLAFTVASLWENMKGFHPMQLSAKYFKDYKRKTFDKKIDSKKKGFLEFYLSDNELIQTNIANYPYKYLKQAFAQKKTINTQKILRGTALKRNCFLLFSWNEFYPNIQSTSPIEKKNYNNNQKVTITNIESVYVRDCCFTNMISSSDGGAILASGATYLLIETSTFNLCTTSGKYGGAVYYKNEGYCSLSKVCSFGCKCTNAVFSFGQFCSISVKNSKDFLNTLHQTSVIKTDTSNFQDPRASISLDNGIVNMNGVNSSNNNAKYMPAFSCYSNIECNIYYSTFSYNQGNIYITYPNNNKNTIESCNFIGNGHATLFHFVGTLVIKDSCILKNTGTFADINPTLIGCTIDVAVFKHSDIPSESYINGLFLMKTKLCPAEYDSVDNLTPLFHTRLKNKVLRTCKRNSNYKISHQNILNFII